MILLRELMTGGTVGTRQNYAYAKPKPYLYIVIFNLLTHHVWVQRPVCLSEMHDYCRPNIIPFTPERPDS